MVVDKRKLKELIKDIDWSKSKPIISKRLAEQRYEEEKAFRKKMDRFRDLVRHKTYKKYGARGKPVYVNLEGDYDYVEHEPWFDYPRSRSDQKEKERIRKSMQDKGYAVSKLIPTSRFSSPEILVPVYDEEMYPKTKHHTKFFKTGGRVSGKPGWHGESRRHSEAARKGWRRR